jgi:hypothetical protein
MKGILKILGFSPHIRFIHFITVRLNPGSYRHANRT